jgi:hypothetical protein
MDAPPDGVAPAEARPRGRGPGRSRTLPVGVAGVIGPPPARAPPAAAMARNGSAAPAPALHAMAATAKWLGPVGQRQQVVIEDVHFTLRSTAE